MADLPTIQGDRVQLQQVMLNLTMNGIEAMTEAPDRQELTIRAERGELDGRLAVLVSVQDRGVGVAQENLGRLLEAFYTTKREGLGMGLPISSSLIQAHGGRLWATRNAECGTKFQYVLPAWNPLAS